jgi:hypothetical protein
MFHVFDCCTMKSPVLSGRKRGTFFAFPYGDLTRACARVLETDSHPCAYTHGLHMGVHMREGHELQMDYGRSAVPDALWKQCSSRCPMKCRAFRHRAKSVSCFRYEMPCILHSPHEMPCNFAPCNFARGKTQNDNPASDAGRTPTPIWTRGVRARFFRVSPIVHMERHSMQTEPCLVSIVHMEQRSGFPV